jgi:hypothetical protein
VLTSFETVVANQAGRFQSPYELTFTRGLPHQTDVICAYLVQGLDDLAVGDDRFVPDKPKPKSKHQR